MSYSPNAEDLRPHTALREREFLLLFLHNFVRSEKRDVRFQSNSRLLVQDLVREHAINWEWLGMQEDTQLNLLV
jgi:hypothetical protein